MGCGGVAGASGVSDSAEPGGSGLRELVSGPEVSRGGDEHIERYQEEKMVAGE